MSAERTLAMWFRAFRLCHAARREQLRQRAEARRRAARVRKLPLPAREGAR